MPTREGLLQMLAMSGSLFSSPPPCCSRRDFQPGQDLDQHFMDNKTVAILAIAACNVFGLAVYGFERGWAVGPSWWAINGVFLATLLVTALTSSRRVALVTLVMLVGVHGVGLLAAERISVHSRLRSGCICSESGPTGA